MRLTHDVFLEQQQRLVMTPELRQAIAILQMSTLELNDYIQQELEENPFLEVKEADESFDQEKQNEDLDKAKIEDWLEYFNDRDIGYSEHDNEDEKSFENFLTKRPTLYEHLEFQLRLACNKQDDLIIGHFIIGSIDNNGYLSIEPGEIATRLQTSESRVQEVLELIQSFHPHGVGARDLAECLLLQLKHFGKDNSLAREIIKNYLPDLAKGRLNKIAQALGITVCEVQEICDLIRTLDPRPGLQYSNDSEIKYIVPDVIVQQLDGENIVIINDSHFPRLIVNQLYENVLRQPDSYTGDVKKYLEERMGAAIWLIKSIEQRRITLYKVSRCIVDIQKEFIDKGVEYMKPLTLKQVADIVEVHESTVSRATNNKYIQTPQGLFELKYFFSSGVDSVASNQKVSSKSIKHMIEELIANEDTTQPLSDQAIVEMLKQKGLCISRRTVAKYRQEMGIMSTLSRKRY
ncbi:MAG: RNA polymerase factor sigma-54 [Syntrophomonadaceae bacterium]|jgi:RNA polymerase sigma-54 factor